IALALYEKYGVEGFGAIVGDWSLALWDSTAEAIVLASDYAGVRPLYYSQQESNVTWSSSLARIVQYCGAEELSREYVVEYLGRGSSRGRTPYVGIFPVPAYHAVVITSHGISSQPFWSLQRIAPTRYANDHDYEERLHDLFREAVSCRLENSSGVVSAELSGGLDSSAVVCMADRLIARREVSASHLTTVTYRQQGSADERFYRAVQEQCSTAEPFYLTAEHCPAAQVGAVGTAAPAWWQLRQTLTADHMRQAGASVLLTGQTGDLVMANWLDDSEQTADYLQKGHFRAAAAEALCWSRSLRVPIYSVLWRSLRSSLSGSPVTGNLDLSEVTSASAKHGDSLSSDSRDMLIETEKTRFQRRSWGDALPSARKRLSSLFSLLDGRLLQCPETLQEFSCTHPYSHRPLVEFMFSIPSGLTCRPGEPRRLMRRAFADVLPNIVRTRRSKAIYDTAFRNAIVPLANHILKEAGCLQVVERGYIDGASFKGRLNRLVNGMECNEGQLRQILLLEFWLRRRGHGPTTECPDATPMRAHSVAASGFH
ncbi:MAG: hypothetical protein H7039_12865, partial [Bryobacteraceae bacterium]|nr:hypothetical protein [Bryobacteraceae bacterium]